MQRKPACHPSVGTGKQRVGPLVGLRAGRLSPCALDATSSQQPPGLAQMSEHTVHRHFRGHPEHKVWVGNVHPSCSSKELWNLLVQKGWSVLHIVICRHRVAIVWLATADDVARVVSHPANPIIRGEILEVDFWVPGWSNSFRASLASSEARFLITCSA